MAVQDEVYATISADAVNVGISTLAISGTTSQPSQGTEYVTVAIRWYYDSNGNDSNGITRSGWFCGDSNGPIDGYANDELFNAYLNTLNDEQVRDVIQNYMESWDATKKADFLNDHFSDSWTQSCIEYVVAQ